MQPLDAALFIGDWKIEDVEEPERALLCAQNTAALAMSWDVRPQSHPCTHPRGR
eukprot:COSAG04_NODE_22072_length_349_cov_3.274809_2_plen_53_part_01